MSWLPNGHEPTTRDHNYSESITWLFYSLRDGVGRHDLGGTNRRCKFSGGGLPERNRMPIEAGAEIDAGYKVRSSREDWAACDRLNVGTDTRFSNQTSDVMQARRGVGP